jgi:hypothetical protein
MPKVVLRAVLPRDRHVPGWLSVEIDGVAKDGYPVLGRGLGDDDLKVNGNTPTGTYIGTLESTAHRKKRFGPNGAVRLEPTGGRALEAKQRGRDGLLIHGGDLNANDELKQTKGCLRVENGHMGRLRMHIEDARAATNMCYVGGNVEVIVEDL